MEHIKNLNFHEEEEDQTLNYVYKSLCILIIGGITVAFGFFPYFWYVIF
jgi:hypothetical protein